MFCRNCGKQLNDGQRFCPNCGQQLAAPAPVQPVAPAPVQPVAPAPVQPAYVPASQQPKQETYIPASQQPKQETYVPAQPKAEPQPTPQQPVYPAPDAFQLPKPEPVAAPAPAISVSAPASEKPKKKKGIGGKIALAVIAVLLVVAIVLAVVNWDGIVRTVKRATMEPTDYAVEVEKKSAAKVAKNLATAYDTALQTSDMSDVSTQTQANIQVSDGVTAILEEVLGQEGIDLALNWIDDISLDADASMKDGKMSADIGVKLNGSHLLTLSAAWDLETQIMWIGIPELSNAYLEMDMEEVLGEDLSDFYPTMLQAQELYSQMVEVLPTGAELEDMINRYIGIILDQMKDVEKTEETVEVDGLEQKLLVMTAEFSANDILDAATALLEEARDDEQVKDLLVGFAEIAGEDAASIEEYYTESLDEMIASIDDAREDAPKGKFLTLETYLDSKDNIVGRTVTVSAEGQKVKISYITVTEGDKFAFEAEVADAATVTGSGTIKDGKSTGEYVLEMMGVEYLTLKTENFYTTDSGAFSGTFALYPESALLDEMDLDSSILQMIGSNVGIQVSLDTTTETPSASFGILAGSTELISIDVSSKIGKAGSIALPEVTVDVNDDAAGYAWLEDLDLDTVLKNLEKTGIPSEYMDSINMIADMFAAEFQ